MTVRIVVPSPLRPLCGGAAELEVAPGRFEDVIQEVDRRCPGFHARLVEDGRLRPELAIAVDGEVRGIGLHEELRDGAEVAIVPALGGGATRPRPPAG